MLAERDTVEIVLTGLNASSRAKLAGYRAPESFQDFFNLAPRVEVIRRLEHRVEASERSRARDVAAAPSNYATGRDWQPRNNTPAQGHARHQPFRQRPQGNNWPRPHSGSTRDLACSTIALQRGLRDLCTPRIARGSTTRVPNRVKTMTAVQVIVGMLHNI